MYLNELRFDLMHALSQDLFSVFTLSNLVKTLVGNINWDSFFLKNFIQLWHKLPLLPPYQPCTVKQLHMFAIFSHREKEVANFNHTRNVIPKSNKNHSCHTSMFCVQSMPIPALWSFKFVETKLDHKSKVSNNSLIYHGMECGAHFYWINFSKLGV